MNDSVYVQNYHWHCCDNEAITSNYYNIKKTKYTTVSTFKK